MPNNGFNQYSGYPTYLPNNHQYYNPYPQYYQSTPQQSSSMPVGIFGRIVNRESDITPNEVPMDGSISLFPLNDYTAIFAKQWNTDGTIKTLKFIPEIQNEVKTDESQEITTSDVIKSMNNRFDKIEKMIGKKYATNQRHNAQSNEKEDANVQL